MGNCKSTSAPKIKSVDLFFCSGRDTGKYKVVVTYSNNKTKSENLYAGEIRTKYGMLLSANSKALVFKEAEDIHKAAIARKFGVFKDLGSEESNEPEPTRKRTSKGR